MWYSGLVLNSSSWAGGAEAELLLWGWWRERVAFRGAAEDEAPLEGCSSSALLWSTCSDSSGGSPLTVLSFWVTFGREEEFSGGLRGHQTAPVLPVRGQPYPWKRPLSACGSYTWAPAPAVSGQARWDGRVSGPTGSAEPAR